MEVVKNGTTVRDFYTETRLSPTFMLVWFIFFVVIFAVSTFVIILLLLVMIKEKKWNSGSSFLIFHLLLLDLAYGNVVLPLTIFTTALSSYNSNAILACPAFGFFSVVGWFVDCWAGTAVAVNRFIAVVYPNHYKYFSSRFFLTIFVISSWIFGMAWAIPGLFGVGNDYVRMFRSCQIRAHYDVAWYSLICMGLFFPNVVQGILYFVVGIKTARRNRNARVAPSGAEEKRRSRGKKVLQMLIISYGTSLVCHVVVPVMLGMLSPAVDKIMELAMVGLLVEMVGFASGPVIYLIVNDEYRKGVKRLIPGRAGTQSVAHATAITVPQSLVPQNSQREKT